MYVPRWFLRELRFIDPTSRVEYDGKPLYRIVKDVDMIIPVPFRGTIHVKGPRTVDVFPYLNDSALTHLRYRKWLGRRMNIIENPKKELAYLEAQEKAAMAKEREIGYEMMAEGMYEGYRLSQKHSVCGGSNVCSIQNKST